MSGKDENPIGKAGTNNDQTSTQQQTPNAVIDVTDKNYWYNRLHPDLQSIPRLPALTLDSWFKTTMFTLLTKMAPTPKTPPDLTKEIVSGIGVYIYPTNRRYKERPPAALLYIHGGGRILGSPDLKACQYLSKELDMPALAVTHRFAPKHPFPAALDDLTNSYQWLVNRLASEGEGDEMEQPIRIAVGGESSGGGLAAELCQKLLDQSKFSSAASMPLPAAQLLIYPMLDDRTCVDEQYESLPLHFIWNKKSNMYAWSSYLGPNHKPGDEKLPEYASASRREDLSQLPPAYIFCGTLDLFLNECRDYAERLEKYGVDVKYDECDGGFHGMLGFGDDRLPVEEMWRNLIAFGKKYLVQA